MSEAIEVKETVTAKVIKGFGALVTVNTDMKLVKKALALNPDAAKLADKEGNTWFQLFLSDDGTGSLNAAGAVLPEDGVIRIHGGQSYDQTKFIENHGTGLLRLSELLKMMEGFAEGITADLDKVITEVSV